MRIALGIMRVALAAVVVALGVVICAVAGAPHQRRFTHLARRWHGLTAAALGVRLRYRGAEFAPGALLLANHVSWFDAVAFGARWPVNFLADSAIARWPVLGWMFRRSGMLFIERGRGGVRAVAQLGACLKKGHAVVLFPEGKTSDGRAVGRFWPRLIQAAIDADAALQPAAIRYFDAAGNRVSRHSFAGDITFLRSLWATVAGPRIIAEITLLEARPPHAARDALAGQAECMVRAVLESQIAAE